MNQPRKYTRKLMDMIDDGLLDPKSVVTMCLSYMSEADVEGMMDANDLNDDERSDEEENEEEDE